MNRSCGITGCPNEARFRCNKCELPLCEEHAFTATVGEQGIYYCQACLAYVQAKLGGDKVENNRETGIGR